MSRTVAATKDGEDRRVRRTRRLLREALNELIVEKGYDHVTVQDVLDRADVGRATFYAHFKDKDDLLVSGSDELREALRQQLAAAKDHHADPEAPALFGFASGLFASAAGHRRRYRALLSSSAGPVVVKYAREQLVTLIREHLDDVHTTGRGKTSVPVEVAVEYIASALMGVLTWWLDGNMRYPAEEMERIFVSLTRPVITAALGLESSASRPVARVASHVT